jgi:hypothetical protein
MGIKKKETQAVVPDDDDEEHGVHFQAVALSSKRGRSWVFVF